MDAPLSGGGPSILVAGSVFGYAIVLPAIRLSLEKRFHACETLDEDPYPIKKSSSKRARRGAPQTRQDAGLRGRADGRRAG